MEQQIAKRYGMALFELANEQGTLKELKEEVSAVLSILKENHQLMELLLHPKVSAGDKIQLIEKALGGQTSHDLMGLVVLTIKKGRQGNLPAILEYCLEEIAKAEGIDKAVVASAETLGTKQMDAVENRLSELTGRKVKPEYQVDESLIGGLFIRIGDRIVDNTIKGKMHHLSRELLTTKLHIEG
jgi:F-type H+-transporting ATPase subunit delta